MINRNPECALCGTTAVPSTARPDYALLPFGVTVHSWICPACWHHFQTATQMTQDERTRAKMDKPARRTLVEDIEHGEAINPDPLRVYCKLMTSGTHSPLKVSRWG